VVSSLSCWRRVCVICGLVCSGAFSRAQWKIAWALIFVKISWAISSFSNSSARAVMSCCCSICVAMLDMYSWCTVWFLSFRRSWRIA